MDPGICSFKHQMAASCLLVLAVNQYPTLDRSEFIWIENLNWQSIIRDGNAVRRQSFLPICGTLHGSQDLFEIASHAPHVRSSRLGESHPLQYGQSGKNMFVTRPRVSTAPKGQFGGVRPACRLVCTTEDCSVQGCESMFPDLSPLGLCGIIACSISNLARTKILGGFANSMLQISSP
jgi:hypothetical protein